MTASPPPVRILAVDFGDRRTGLAGTDPTGTIASPLEPLIGLDDKSCATAIAEVARESYPDPTVDDERWVVVDVVPVAPLAEPVTLAAVKADPALRDMALVRQSRLSVMPVTSKEFNRVLKLGKTVRPG